MSTVFISSVARGFESFRAAAREAVASLDHKPVMFELLVAAPHSPEVACLTEAAQSDIYVLIMGERYGFETPGGISVTQAEFRAAKDAKRPILVFVQDCQMETKQGAFKSEVMDYRDGLFRATFKTDLQLTNELTRALNSLGKRRETAPVEEFQQLVQQASKEYYVGIERNGVVLQIAFWPQPARERLLDNFEKEPSRQLLKLAGDGIIDLSEGYKNTSGHSHVGCRSNRVALAYFETGLILVQVDPTVEQKGFHSFAGYYISPVRLRDLAYAFGHLFDATGGWVSMSISGMDYKVVAEAPTGQGSQSMTMRSNGLREYQAEKLFIPYVQTAFESWVDSAIAVLRRKFAPPG